MTKNSLPSGSAAGLHRDAVGLVPVLFQSVANMAPGAAVAFSILFAAPYAGGATPLAVLIGLGLCLLVALTIGQMAKHLPSAGGLYTYNARGLGTGFGFMVGWAFLLAEVVVAPGGLLMLGIVASTVLHTQLGWPLWTWAPFAAGTGLLVWFLVLRGIKLSTAASVALGVFELVVFLALAISLIVHAGRFRGRGAAGRGGAQPQACDTGCCLRVLPDEMPLPSLPPASAARWAGSACFPGSTPGSGHLGSLPTSRCCWPSAMRWGWASPLAHR